MADEGTIENVVIIGSGPAGLTAAIYAARAELKPLVFAGAIPGGQLMLTTVVENFPGFQDGIDGPELMVAMQKQAERFGARVVPENVTSVDFKSKPLIVKTAKKEVKAKSVIIATGASVRWLGLENEQRLIGKGVSSCATCDGFFFKGKEVVVVGGGDTAIADAIFLTRFATKVTVVHRRDELRASKVMQTKAKKNEKISFVWDTVVEDILGQDKVEGVKLKNVKTDEASELKCDGVFVAIGHIPETKFLKGNVELDEKGYVKISDKTKTSIEGVFVAGDVMDAVYKQAISAAGDGCRAAMDTEKYLADKE